MEPRGDEWTGPRLWSIQPIGGQPRSGYAVVDGVTGAATPTIVRILGSSVNSITLRPDLVLVGGGFQNVELEVRESFFALADCELAAYYADVDDDGYGDELTIRTNLRGSLRISLMDMTGRVVFNEQRYHTANAGMVLTMNALASGSYLLRIGSEGGSTVQRVMRE
ncbi:MAG: T9SS type A sorting domain-containing protein [Flavobacteriales bacterium]|nr:T9SS type A sorting domain-containing protein [Flavobacteriales bacterium]